MGGIGSGRTPRTTAQLLDFFYEMDDESGGAWIEYPEIIDEFGDRSESSVKSALYRLKRKGLIENLRVHFEANTHAAYRLIAKGENQ